MARQSLKTTKTSANQAGVLILVRRHISVHQIIGMKMGVLGWTSVVLNLRHSKMWIGGCYLTREGAHCARGENEVKLREIAAAMQLWKCFKLLVGDFNRSQVS